MIWRDGGLLTFARERACSVLEWALLLCDGDGNNNGGDGCQCRSVSVVRFFLCPTFLLILVSMKCLIEVCGVMSRVVGRYEIAPSPAATSPSSFFSK